MDAQTAVLDRLMTSAVYRARKASGVDVVFGGLVQQGSAADRLLISWLSGTHGTSLDGLSVPRGLGLGGRVLALAAPSRVVDYAGATGITHDYDAIVVKEERIVSVAAVPIVSEGRVRAVLYGAMRRPEPVGDGAMRALEVAAAQISAASSSEPPAESAPEAHRRTALAELDEALALATGDLRERLRRVRELLREEEAEPAGILSPRERDVLRHAATGATNLEIAVAEGLRPETVKAYLRSAMRKLDVGSRTAACLTATRRGLI